MAVTATASEEARPAAEISLPAGIAWLAERLSEGDAGTTGLAVALNTFRFWSGQGTTLGGVRLSHGAREWATRELSEFERDQAERQGRTLSESVARGLARGEASGALIAPGRAGELARVAEHRSNVSAGLMSSLAAGGDERVRLSATAFATGLDARKLTLEEWPAEELSGMLAAEYETTRRLAEALAPGTTAGQAYAATGGAAGQAAYAAGARRVKAKGRTGKDVKDPEFEKLHPRAPKGRVGGGTWIQKGEGYGESGPSGHVTQLQTRLNELFPDTPIRMDGKFGDATERQLKKFQETYGLEETGVLDPTTVEALRNPPPLTVAQVQAQEKAAETSKSSRSRSSRSKSGGGSSSSGGTSGGSSSGGASGGSAGVGSDEREVSFGGKSFAVPKESLTPAEGHQRGENEVTVTVDGKSYHVSRDDLRSVGGKGDGKGKTTKKKGGPSESEIHTVQDLLDQLGFDLSAKGVTGKMDAATRVAIQRFQREHDLPANGRITPSLVAAIREALSKSKKKRNDPYAQEAIMREASFQQGGTYQPYGGAAPFLPAQAGRWPVGTQPPNLREADAWAACENCVHFWHGPKRCSLYGWPVDGNDLCDSHATVSPEDARRSRRIEDARGAETEAREAGDVDAYIRAKALREALTDLREQSAYAERLHPRGRSGRWIKKLGNMRVGTTIDVGGGLSVKRARGNHWTLQTPDSTRGVSDVGQAAAEIERHEAAHGVTPRTTSTGPAVPGVGGLPPGETAGFTRRSTSRPYTRDNPTRRFFDSAQAAIRQGREWRKSPGENSTASETVIRSKAESAQRVLDMIASGELRAEPHDLAAALERMNRAGGDIDRPVIQGQLEVIQGLALGRLPRKRMVTAPRRAAVAEEPPSVLDQLTAIRPGGTGKVEGFKVRRDGETFAIYQGTTPLGPSTFDTPRTRDVKSGTAREVARHIGGEVEAELGRMRERARSQADEALLRGDSRRGYRSPFAGRASLSLSAIPDEWAVRHGYAERVTTHKESFLGYERDAYGGGGYRPKRAVETIRWKPGLDPERVLLHYLGGVRPPENFPEGSRAAQQFEYPGRGKAKAKNKAERAALITKLTQALRARAVGDWDGYGLALQEACELRKHVSDEDLVEVEMKADIQEVKSSAYPSLERVPGKQNWVDRAGGLPSLIERVAKHLHYERGYEIGRSIATAVNWAKKMCSTGTAFGGKVKVKGASQAAACKAVAQWEAKKAKGRLKEAEALVEAAEHPFFPTLEEALELADLMEEKMQEYYMLDERLEDAVARRSAAAAAGDASEFTAALEEERALREAVLTAAGRKHIAKSNFVFPEKAPGSGSYPIHDRAHGANALARSAGKPEAAAVKRKVCSRYPDLPACKED